jgi:tRNA(Glu) U13 pseudouridine synthase TruD
LNSRLRGIVLSDAEYQSKELALGMAYGNRFSISLREFDSKDNDEVIEVNFIYLFYL